MSLLRTIASSEIATGGLNLDAIGHPGSGAPNVGQTFVHLENTQFSFAS